MQQLSGELENVSTDAPLVCSTTRPVLNKDESPSAQDIVLTDNNLEVDLLQYIGDRVSVIMYTLFGSSVQKLLIFMKRFIPKTEDLGAFSRKDRKTFRISFAAKIFTQAE